MKAMTDNLKYFSALVLIFSITFFYLLYSALLAQSYNHIWIYATSFGVALFISGFVFGYQDSVRKSRLDLGFQYHLMTFIIVNAIGIPSLFIAMGFSFYTLLTGVLHLPFWALGLFVHHYYSSRSIKGMDKKDLFA